MKPTSIAHAKLGSMRRHLKNTNESPVRLQIYMVAGVVWIAIWIAILLKTSILNAINTLLLGAAYCQTCFGPSLLTIVVLLSLFFIGSLGVSYGVIYKTNREGKAKQITRFVAFAFAVCLASLVIYYWANLFVNGLD